MDQHKVREMRAMIKRNKKKLAKRDVGDQQKRSFFTL